MIQRIAVAEKYRPIYERQALLNKSLNGGDKKSDLKNSATPIPKEDKIDVRAKLAQTAGVSTDTYSKGKKILDSDDEELKKRVLSGKTSISAGYKAINLYFLVRVQMSLHKIIQYAQNHSLKRSENAQKLCNMPNKWI